MADLPDTDAQDQIQDFFAHEEFLAFFDFHLPAPSGRVLEGLCKVARPQPDARDRVDYVCLTFIIDTPDQEKVDLVEKVIGRLDSKAFKRHIPTLQTMTSVPTSNRRAENYIHQMDLIFGKHAELDIRELVPMIMFSIRKEAELKTESPQWWDDGAIKPQPTAAEKANWGNRFKALFKAMSS